MSQDSKGGLVQQRILQAQSDMVTAMDIFPPSSVCFLHILLRCQLAEAAVVAAAAAEYVSSSYRVKFKKKQFLELIKIVKPKLIYHVKRLHFFAYDGFVMYSMECQNSDFKQNIIEAVEFSNEPWYEKK